METVEGRGGGLGRVQTRSFVVAVTYFVTRISVLGIVAGQAIVDSVRKSKV